MKPSKEFANQSQEFWATVKLISQKLKYTDRKTGRIKVPTIAQIIELYTKLELNTNKIYFNDTPTEFGVLLLKYFAYRAEVLNDAGKDFLMNKDQARQLFDELQFLYAPQCPLPLNKQSGEKKNYAFFTCIINILIEKNLKNYPCNYSAAEFTAFTQHKFPIRSLSRRVDGSFPSVINPVAIWEIKEYYYTTSFGSRVADGVYETMLDGYELQEVRKTLNVDIKHYLMIDDYSTWWIKGRSYLCRLIDMMHMGLVTEVLFGKEVLNRIPELVKEWISFYEQHKTALDN